MQRWDVLGGSHSEAGGKGGPGGIREVVEGSDSGRHSSRLTS